MAKYHADLEYANRGNIYVYGRTIRDRKTGSKIENYHSH